MVAQLVKNLPAMQETQIQSLAGEDPLEKEMAMATHSSILDWRIPWAEEPGRLQSMESQESDGNYRVNNKQTKGPILKTVESSAKRRFLPLIHSFLAPIVDCRATPWP